MRIVLYFANTILNIFTYLFRLLIEVSLFIFFIAGGEWIANSKEVIALNSNCQDLEKVLTKKRKILNYPHASNVFMHKLDLIIFYVLRHFHA